jgi:hypothetical protein
VAFSELWRRWNPIALWRRWRADAIRREHFDSGLVKVAFDLVEGPFAIDEPPFGSESVWAAPLDERLFEIRNSLFYVYGVSWRDVVEAEEVDDCLTAVAVSERGGHSTYRVILAEAVSHATWDEEWAPFQAQGCTYEGAEGRLIAIDVPPRGDVAAVFRLLEEGENLGLWEFEEAHCGHPVSPTEARHVPPGPA